MIDNDYCCAECDYWEGKIDIHIENQIKEAKLERIAKKQSLGTKLIIPNNIKAHSGTHKAREHGIVEVTKVGGENSNTAKVGLTSSQ